MLEFFSRKRIVYIYQLVEHFGYTYYSALNRLRLLRAQGLATTDGKGHWVLTDEGIRRMRWFQKTQEQKEKTSPMQ